MESEAVASNKTKLDVIHFLEIKRYLTEKVKQFQTGCIKNHFSEGTSYTIDNEILRSVSGLYLEFSDIKLPHYHKRMKVRFSSKEFFLADEIKNLSQKDIKESQNKEGEFISSIFVVPKSEDLFRMISNLKSLTEDLSYIHFKMEKIKSILTLGTPNCYMAKIDIKDTYYSVPILSEHQKYLKFYFRENLYQFTCLPNGLCLGPRKFIKLLKPPFSYQGCSKLL